MFSILNNRPSRHSPLLVFCPSGKKCFHLSEPSPWTFMVSMCRLFRSGNSRHSSNKPSLSFKFNRAVRSTRSYVRAKPMAGRYTPRRLQRRHRRRQRLHWHLRLQQQRQRQRLLVCRRQHQRRHARKVQRAYRDRSLIKSTTNNHYKPIAPTIGYTGHSRAAAWTIC